jgi:hypothetical protein
LTVVLFVALTLSALLGRVILLLLAGLATLLALLSAPLAGLATLLALSVLSALLVTIHILCHERHSFECSASAADLPVSVGLVAARDGRVGRKNKARVYRS